MNKKALKTTVASLALVGAIGVGATLAYLSSESNKLTNTFTVGEGYPEIDPYGTALILHESKINARACDLVDYDGRTLCGNDYVDIQAGDSLTKDPKLTLAANSVDSYLYMQVSGLNKLDEQGISIKTNIYSEENLKGQWIKVDTDNVGLDGIYRYIGTDSNVNYYVPTNKDEVTTTSPLFDKLTFDGNIDYSKVTLEDVIIKGAAVQATYKEDGNQEIISTSDADKSAKNVFDNAKEPLK